MHTGVEHGAAAHAHHHVVADLAGDDGGHGFVEVGHALVHLPRANQRQAVVGQGPDLQIGVLELPGEFEGGRRPALQGGHVADLAAHPGQLQVAPLQAGAGLIQQAGGTVEPAPDGSVVAQEHVHLGHDHGRDRRPPRLACLPVHLVRPLAVTPTGLQVLEDRAQHRQLLVCDGRLLVCQRLFEGGSGGGERSPIEEGEGTGQTPVGGGDHGPLHDGTGGRSWQAHSTPVPIRPQLGGPRSGRWGTTRFAGSNVSEPFGRLRSISAMT